VVSKMCQTFQCGASPCPRGKAGLVLVARRVLRVSWWLNHLLPLRQREKPPDTARNVAEHEVLVEHCVDHELFVERSWTVQDHDAPRPNSTIEVSAADADLPTNRYGISAGRVGAPPLGI